MIHSYETHIKSADNCTFYLIVLIELIMTENKTKETNWLGLEYEGVMQAIREGDESAKTKLAWLMLSGLGCADVDEDGAVVLLEERVTEGDGDALWKLGVCYEFGMGIEQDVERAEALYRRSSERGNERGKSFVEHDCGRGVEKMNVDSLCIKQ